MCSVAQSCLILCDPMDCSPLGSFAMRFPRQEFWSELPFLSPGDFPTQGSYPGLLHLLQWQADSLPLSHLGSPEKSQVQVGRVLGGGP